MQAANALVWHVCRTGQAGQHSCLAMGCSQAIKQLQLKSDMGPAARAQHPAVLLRSSIQLQQICQSDLARRHLWQSRQCLWTTVMSATKHNQTRRQTTAYQVVSLHKASIIKVTYIASQSTIFLCICPGQVCSSYSTSGTGSSREWPSLVLACRHGNVQCWQTSCGCACRWCCCRFATPKAQRVSSAGNWHFSVARSSLDSSGSLTRYCIITCLKTACCVNELLMHGLWRVTRASMARNYRHWPGEA
jgi:hypothetical protein